jgi:ribonuclease P protein subunit RPR2
MDAPPLCFLGQNIMTMKSASPGVRKIARERIDLLFRRAEEVVRVDPALSDRYVDLARRIAMKQRIRLDRELRRRFCHHCYRFLAPGVNMRVRIHRGKVVITCSHCKGRARYPLRRLHA